MKKIFRRPGNRSGGAAGLFAQTSTYPLHVVRRRMQAGKVTYKSTWHGLRSIYATEGVMGGLYKGLTLTFVKTKSTDFNVGSRLFLLEKGPEVPGAALGDVQARLPACQGGRARACRIARE